MLLATNFVTQSSLTFRASLRAAIIPMGPATPYADWRIAAGIAAVAEIRTVPGYSARYRLHGSNMVLGANSLQTATNHRKEIGWRRWMMTHLAEDETVTAVQLRRAITDLGWGIREAMLHFGLQARAIDALAPRPAVLGVPGPAKTRRSRAALARFVADPLDGAAAIDLEVALVLEGRHAETPQPPLAALAHRPRLTLTRLSTLLNAPEVAERFARETAAGESDTLLVLAPAEADLSELFALAQASPAIGDPRSDVNVMCEPRTPYAQALLADWAHSRLCAELPDSPYAALPLHELAGPAELAEPTPATA